MEIDIEEMLSGVSMDSQEDGSTFCNMYTSNGIALTNTALCGLAVEDNLLEPLRNADFDDGYTQEAIECVCKNLYMHFRRPELHFCVDFPWLLRTGATAKGKRRQRRANLTDSSAGWSRLRFSQRHDCYYAPARLL